MSIVNQEPAEGDESSVSSTMADQPLVQLTTKASILIPATTPAVAKSKDNPYSKPGIGKWYRCGESGHKSNECPKRRQVNMADYEEEDDVLIETELEDSDLVEEHDNPVACVIQKVLYS